MKRADVAIAVDAILASKTPVRLFVRRVPGYADQAHVTTLEPTGAFASRSVLVGAYDASITLAELRDDLLFAEQELSRQQTRIRKAQQELAA